MNGERKRMMSRLMMNILAVLTGMTIGGSIIACVMMLLVLLNK
jgi:hypothetical protein